MLDWSLLSGAITRPAPQRRGRRNMAVVADAACTSPALGEVGGPHRVPAGRRGRHGGGCPGGAQLMDALPDNLGPAVYLWSGAAVFAVNLTVTRVVTERNVGRAVVGVTAAVVVVAACANQVNTIYGAYVSPRNALHMVHPDDIALRDAPSYPQLPDSIRSSRAGPHHRG